jgi:hypothetical protein
VSGTAGTSNSKPKSVTPAGLETPARRRPRHRCTP